MRLKNTKQNQKINLFIPRSFCPHCQKKISWHHNLPILSFVLLRGKSACCKQNISKQYLAIEILSSVIALYFTIFFGFNILSNLAIIFSYFLLALASIDINTKLLPNQLTYPFLGFGLTVNFFGILTPWQDAILGAAIGYFVLWTINKIFLYLRGVVGIGAGDFKLLAALGAWLGVTALPWLIFIASFSGSIYGLFLIGHKKGHLQTKIPFGPFLALAGYLVFSAQLAKFHFKN